MRCTRLSGDCHDCHGGGGNRLPRGLPRLPRLGGRQHADHACADQVRADEVRADRQLEDYQRADHRGADDEGARDRGPG